MTTETLERRVNPNSPEKIIAFAERAQARAEKHQETEGALKKLDAADAGTARAVRRAIADGEITQMPVIETGTEDREAA